MEKKDFEEKIGKAFSVSFEGDIVKLTLKKVEPLKKAEGAEHVKNLRQDPFSLVFVGPEDVHLPDNTYTMSADGWEDKQIFISAFKQEKDAGLFYDAVFT